MASGKQTKRRRRQAQQTPPPVQRKGQRRAASPKVLIAIAAAVVLAGAAVAAALALTGGSSSSTSSHSTLPGSPDVIRLFAGIPQNGNVLGSPKAPVTLIEYVDLQCPGCQAFETQVMPELVPRYVRTGKLKVEARPIAFLGPDSERGRRAALAAARQNRFFNFAQLLYLNQGPENSGWLDDAMIESAATSIPRLDVKSLLAGRNSSSVQSQEKTYDSQADADQVSETPTILVGGTGGRPHKVVASLDAIAAAIASAQA
jgi:protein-disulfide isomerase